MSQATLAGAIQASLNRAEFGYHELTDTEAAAAAAAVVAWCLDELQIDLLEMRG